MNNEYKNGGAPKNLSDGIKRPQNSGAIGDDVEGIRRPAYGAPQSGAPFGGTQNIPQGQSSAGAEAPRRQSSMMRKQPLQNPGKMVNPTPRRAVSTSGTQQARAVSVARPKANDTRRAVGNQSAKQVTGVKSSQQVKKDELYKNSLSNTRSTDRESIRKAKKSKEAKARIERITAEEEGGGTSAVMSLIKAILYIVIVVAVSGLISYYAIVFVNDMYAFVKNPEEVEVTIPEYATVEEIADILGEAGVVEYPDLLVLYARLKKIDKTYEFIAGDYTVNGMMNYDELFYAFVKHKSYEVVRITIPEGYTIDEMITLFTENGIGTRAGFIDAINNYDFDFDFVRALDETDLTGRTYRLEGYLYPDTYEFYKSSSEVTVIYKLLSRFNVIFSSDFYEKAESLGYSVDQIMTLASMIEKEARYAQDYEMVSSVFHNRLNSPNFPKLESDATIMYAIQVRDGERKSSLTGEDLNYDTPYNSYMYEGLPPGPIANPGYEAITCALWPASTKYYYFVSDNYGNTYFSRTNAEHEAAKAKVAQINAEN